MANMNNPVIENNTTSAIHVKESQYMPNITAALITRPTRHLPRASKQEGPYAGFFKPLYAVTFH